MWALTKFSSPPPPPRCASFPFPSFLHRCFFFFFAPLGSRGVLKIVVLPFDGLIGISGLLFISSSATHQSEEHKGWGGVKSVSEVSSSEFLPKEKVDVILCFVFCFFKNILSSQSTFPGKRLWNQLERKLDWHMFSLQRYNQSVCVCVCVCVCVSVCPLNIYTTTNENGFMHKVLILTAKVLLRGRKVND